MSLLFQNSNQTKLGVLMVTNIAKKHFIVMLCSWLFIISAASVFGWVNVSLESPIDGYNATPGNINFTFTPIADINESVDNCSLWLNSSIVTWGLNVTNSSSVESATVNGIVVYLPEDTYIWNVQCYSNATVGGNFSSTNMTLIVDGTFPSLNASGLTN